MAIPILPEEQWQRVRGKPGTRYAGRDGVAVGYDREKQRVRVMYPTSDKWRNTLNRIFPIEELEVTGPWLLTPRRKKS